MDSLLVRGESVESLWKVISFQFGEDWKGLE